MKSSLTTRLENSLPYILGFAALVMYKVTQAPGITWGDAGEFLATSSSLGIGHPYGHPLYWLAGRAAMLILPGSPASSMNNLSALSAAVVCMFITLLAQLWLRRSGHERTILPATFTTLIFATGTAFWSQALLTEVYAFHALFFVIALYSFDRYFFSGSRVEFLYLSAYAFGLTVTLGMYVLPVLLIPLTHVLSADAQRRSEILRKLPVAAFWLLVGLTPWLYLLARSQSAPPLSAETLHSVTDVIDYLGRSAYREIIPAGINAVGMSFELTAIGFWETFGVVGTIALIVALVSNLRTVPGQVLRVRTLGGLMMFLIFAVLLPLTLSFRQMVGMEVYFIPALILFVPPVAIGLAILMNRYRSHFIAIAIFMLIIIPVIFKFPVVSMAGSHLAADFDRYLANELPPGAKVTAVSDELAYVLMYQIACKSNPRGIDLNLPGATNQGDPLGGLGAVSLSDFVEIDQSFLALPQILDRCEIAGPLLSMRGATPESKALEREFVNSFAFDSLAAVSLNRHDRSYLAQIWSRRGFYWQKKSESPGTMPHLVEACLDSSIACYRMAFRLDDFTYEGANHGGNLAIALAERGAVVEAITCADRAERLNPHAEAPWRGRLTIALKQERYEDALTALERLLVLSANRGEIRLDMAALYAWRLNQPEKAREAYRRGIEEGGRQRPGLERALKGNLK